MLASHCVSIACDTDRITSISKNHAWKAYFVVVLNGVKESWSSLACHSYQFLYKIGPLVYKILEVRDTWYA
jgi:hypothetical protein